MNGYSKFRENSDNHTIQTSSDKKTLEECQEKDIPNHHHNPDINIIIPSKDLLPNMKNENFMFRKNHSTTSQRFANGNSELKNMMRRAFSTRKAYWRLEDDAGNIGVDVGNGDFVQEHDLDKNYEATRGNNNIEGKKKKKSFKRWKKIFHF